MRAVPTREPNEGMISQSGEAMLLMIHSVMWEALVIQAQHEGKSPGEVLNNALCAYLSSERGSEAAVDYVKRAAIGGM